MDPTEFGVFLAAERKAKGMTQKDLAEKLGVSDKAVSKWERGVCLPDVAKFDSIADALGITDLEVLRAKRVEALPELPAEPLLSGWAVLRLFRLWILTAGMLYLFDILDMLHFLPTVGITDLFPVPVCFLGAVWYALRDPMPRAIPRRAFLYGILFTGFLALCLWLLDSPYIIWENCDRVIRWLFPNPTAFPELWPGATDAAPPDWSAGFLIRWFLRLRIISLPGVFSLMACFSVYPLVRIFRITKGNKQAIPI